MPNTLTWRLRERSLELSLWRNSRTAPAGLLALTLGLTTAVYLLVSGVQAPNQADDPALWPGLVMGLLLAGAWGLFFRFLLWNHLGREIIRLDEHGFRIVHDFRFWRREIAQRTYTRMDISYWTDVQDDNRTGWLVLTCDGEPMASRVALSVAELEQAVAIVRGHMTREIEAEGRVRFLHPN